MFKAIALVGVGGGAGSIFRFLISFYSMKGQQNDFPLSTFIVNISGCLLIGLFLGFFDQGNFLNANLKLLLVTGFCGGYTTFSAFSSESLSLFQTGNYFTGFFYIIASILLGLLFVYVGYFFGSRML